MSEAAAGTHEARGDLDRLLGELRPKLHRYCARMAGSVIDGEDVVQEALLKAIEAFAKSGPIANPEGWLFRIAHNTALDFLRRRARQEARRADEDPEMIVDPSERTQDREIAAMGLRAFMRLPVGQRSSVVLMDVLGYSLREIGAITQSTLPTVKAALHRGRARLRELANEPEHRTAPVLAEPERRLLSAYVERFNARDFDAIRDMLAEEVRLELVAKLHMDGAKEVGRYLHNYERLEGLTLVPRLVDGRPAVLVTDRSDPKEPPLYLILLGFAAGKVAAIRDFRFARYVMDGAELLPLAGGLG
jgi:RNA polymerase sigma-70 factor (ECF subfamily)